MTKPIRVQCFVDGFNLYHAVEKIGASHLKWFDLRKLIAAFTDPKTHVLNEVFYFSAYATWRAVSYARHQQYVAALQATGVTPVMGRGCVETGRQGLTAAGLPGCSLLDASDTLCALDGLLILFGQSMTPTLESRQPPIRRRWPASGPECRSTRPPA
jgi:hypothetical protein